MRAVSVCALPAASESVQLTTHACRQHLETILRLCLLVSAAHQFYYAKAMRPDEAYIFTCYDSRYNRARFTPHTGFTDPTARPDAPERESIEIRAYAFWENEEPQPIAREL